MPHLSTPGRRPAAAVALPILLLACSGLTACGGSSSSSSTATPPVANAAATSTETQSTAPTHGGASGPAGGSTTPAGGTTTPAGGATTPAGGSASPAGGPGAARFTAARECLQKNGITLPRRPVGGHPGEGLSGLKLPKGMTHAQYLEVLKKCVGSFGGGGGGRAASHGRRAFNSPSFRKALVSFTACLRQNGINVPAPNTTGKGPIFETKGIDTSSPQFKQAEAKCRGVLLAALRPKAGAGAGAAGGGAPAGSAAPGSSAG